MKDNLAVGQVWRRPVDGSWYRIVRLTKTHAHMKAYAGPDHKPGALTPHYFVLNVQEPTYERSWIAEKWVYDGKVVDKKFIRP